MMRMKEKETMSLAAEDDHINRKTLWVLLAGVFLISFSLLAFEISLTRVLSVMLSYHYVFIVVSLALLGLGSGGIFVHLFQREVQHGNNQFRTLALFASLLALSIPLSVLFVTWIAAFYWLFLFIPFFFAGVLLTEVFRTFPALSSRIYGADLIGAAAGSLGVVLALDKLGGTNTVLVLGIIGVIPAFFFTVRATGINSKGIILPAINLLLILVLFGTNLAGFRTLDVPIGTDQAKEIHHALMAPSQQGEIIDTRWSAFGRTDLVSFRNDPGIMIIYLDGTAGTPMYKFNGDISNPNPEILKLKTEFPGYLPFANLQENERNNALIIGPGGGRDILLALLGGVEKITAVEVNKDLVDLVNKYAWYNGDIYSLKNVSVVVDEGRSFLKRQKEKYDIIMLSLPVTKTSRSLEGYSLTENFLFTTDSIDDYLEHLTDNGRLIVVAHSNEEILRLISISLPTLSQTGVSNGAGMEQIYVIGSEHYPVFVLGKTPFATSEMQSIHRSIHKLEYAPTLSFLPTIKLGNCTPHEEAIRFDECAMLNPLFTAVESGEVKPDGLEKIAGQHGLDISPVTDDNPFFYKLERGIPQPVSLVLWASIIIFLIAVTASLKYSKELSTSGLQLRFALFFTMLGIGFMLVEISAIQRFILFLGQPVLSLAILLFSILLGAGIGSIYSGRFASEKIAKAIAIVSLFIGALLSGYAFFMPFILKQLLGFELGLRLLTTFGLLAPLGFLMGFPFPLGIRLLKEMKLESYIPWMWGINGISSVLGSALTLAIAITFGFTEALLFGAACYFIVSLLSQGIHSKRGSA